VTLLTQRPEDEGVKEDKVNEAVPDITPVNLEEKNNS
jgi:hypothetical protein